MVVILKALADGLDERAVEAVVGAGLLEPIGAGAFVLAILPIRAGERALLGEADRFVDGVRAVEGGDLTPCETAAVVEGVARLARALPRVVDVGVRLGAKGGE